MTSDPKNLSVRVIEGLNSGDVDLVVSLYEQDGIIAPDSAQVVAGHAAIRSLTVGFVSQRPYIVLDDLEVVRAGDIALIRSHVTLTMADAKGEKTETRLEPIVVARRQSDGYWRVVIDRPLPQQAAQQVAPGDAPKAARP